MAQYAESAKHQETLALASLLGKGTTVTKQVRITPDASVVKLGRVP